MREKQNIQDIIFEMSINNSGYEFTSSIDEALTHTEHELDIINETIDSIKLIKPEYVF